MNRRMRAVIIEQPGREGKHVVIETNIPTPAPDEVLIKVAYVGINRADLFQLQGRYPQPENKPPIPGMEVSGKIVATGENTKHWKIGEPVCALVNEGAYAEYCVASQDHTFRIPANISQKEAVALPEALVTTWLSIFQEGEFKKGERVLIHAGASGIGTLAIQTVRAFGGEVYATAGSEEKCERCISLGATEAINYKTQDFTQVIRTATKNKGVDIILDPVGGDTLQKNLDILSKGGRLISIGFLKGANAEIHAGVMLRNHLRWIGSTVRNRSSREKTLICKALSEKVWPALEKGLIRPVIDSEFPLADVEKALKHMEQNLNLGKITLHI